MMGHALMLVCLGYRKMNSSVLTYLSLRVWVLPYFLFPSYTKKKNTGPILPFTLIPRSILSLFPPFGSSSLSHLLPHLIMHRLFAEDPSLFFYSFPSNGLLHFLLSLGPSSLVLGLAMGPSLCEKLAQVHYIDLLSCCCCWKFI